MIVVGCAGADLVEHGIHFRRAQFRLIRADQQTACKALIRQFQHGVAVFAELFDLLAEAGASRIASGQAERHIRAQCGGNLLQPFDGPIKIP